MHVYQSGGGSPDLPVLLFLHGGAFSHAMFRDCLPHFEKLGYRVLAPDMPGHGLSNKQRFSMEGAVEQLHEQLILPLVREGRKVVVIGISLGGQVALGLVARHPTSLASAVLGGVSLHPPDGKAPWETPRLPLEDQEWMQLLIEGVAALGMENAPGIQDESFNKVITPAKGLEGVPPVLVLNGQHDVAMALRDESELVPLLKSLNPRSRGERLPGAWHNHPIDVPERFNQRLQQWLEEL